MRGGGATWSVSSAMILLLFGFVGVAVRWQPYTQNTPRMRDPIGGGRGGNSGSASASLTGVDGASGSDPARSGTRSRFLAVGWSGGALRSSSSSDTSRFRFLGGCCRSSLIIMTMRTLPRVPAKYSFSLRGMSDSRMWSKISHTMNGNGWPSTRSEPSGWRVKPGAKVRGMAAVFVSNRVSEIWSVFVPAEPAATISIAGLSR